MAAHMTCSGPRALRPCPGPAALLATRGVHRLPAPGTALPLRCARAAAATGDDPTPEAGPGGAAPPPQAGSTGGAGGGQSGARFQSSWGAKEAYLGTDYLYELGNSSDVNLNIDTGQTAANIDSLFTGKVLGHQSDIADGSLRSYELRSLANIVGDYYVPPSFLEKVTVHVAKNYLVAQKCFDRQTQVPLILGVWGGKGQGKSFMVELCFRKLGVEAIIMSAGELENEWAGTPGRLIRERYRKAAEQSRVRGKLACLLINDIDAGIGHFANTQITVNNQIVVASLMNICDHPTRVNTHMGIQEAQSNWRIPIIVTGNDFSKCFAPLLRDGRMEKFFWDPTRTDLAAILLQMYRDDGLAEADMHTLLDAFPGQSLDFFGALRSCMYDGQIRDWIRADVLQGEISEDNERLGELGRRLVRGEDLPTFKPIELTVEQLLEEGRRLAAEQDRVNEIRLAKEYLPDQAGVSGSLVGFSG